jgi:hypothetical protein
MEILENKQYIKIYDLRNKYKFQNLKTNKREPNISLLSVHSSEKNNFEFSNEVA